MKHGKEYYDEARQDGFKSGKEQGFKTATIEDIIFMIRYGISKKDLLKKYSEKKITTKHFLRWLRSKDEPTRLSI